MTSLNSLVQNLSLRTLTTLEAKVEDGALRTAEACLRSHIYERSLEGTIDQIVLDTLREHLELVLLLSHIPKSPSIRVEIVFELTLRHIHQSRRCVLLPHLRHISTLRQQTLCDCFHQPLLFGNPTLHLPSHTIDPKKGFLPLPRQFTHSFGYLGESVAVQHHLLDQIARNGI